MTSPSQASAAGARRPPADPRQAAGAWSLAGLCATGSILQLSAAWWWVGECARSWSAHLALAALLVAGVLLWRRQRRAALLAVSAAVLCLPPWLRGPLAEWHPESADTLRVCSANRFYHRLGTEPEAALLGCDADLLYVAEARTSTSVLLAEAYPHVVTRLTGDPFGHVIASRHPLTVRLHGDPVFPVVDIRLDHPDGSWRVLALHPPPPMSAAALAYRNEALQLAAELAADHDGPFLLIGDWNCTIASPAFAALCQRSGAGRAQRWPSGSWPGPLSALGIAIDHVLAGPEVAFTSYRHLPLPGSDHHAIVAEVTRVPARER